jgi:hypothetical protein
MRRNAFTEETAVAVRIALELQEHGLPTQAFPILVKYGVMAYRAAALYSPPTMPYLVVTIAPPSQGTAVERRRIEAVPEADVAKFVTSQARAGAFLVDLPEIARDVAQYYERRGVAA